MAEGSGFTGLLWWLEVFGFANTKPAFNKGNGIVSIRYGDRVLDHMSRRNMDVVRQHFDAYVMINRK